MNIFLLFRKLSIITISIFFSNLFQNTININAVLAAAGAASVDSSSVSLSDSF
jgi:hypothetical protein